MQWKRSSWILIGLLLAAFSASAVAQIATTQVSDTIYQADGTTATGSVLISWPAFTTSSGNSIPTGSTSATIATGGALSVQLVPNAGSSPMGSYYTVVYHLDDGSVSRQYWVVPVSTSAVKVSAIESTVMPISVAMQTVSKSYVDTAIAAAGTGGVQASGDIGGTNAAPVVTGIQGHAVSAAAPTNGQALVYNGALYIPRTVTAAVTLEHAFSGAGTFNYAHNLNTLYPLMTCYVNSGSLAYTASNVDANDIAITVIAASDISCTFGPAVPPTPSAPVVTGNPTNWSGSGVFSFTVAATSYPTPTVQWQTDSGTSGATWTNVSGATSTTYSASSAGESGWRFRAVFTNASGTAATTAATATITGDITTDLLNYWPMNEGSGTTFIDSIAADNITHNAAWSGTTATFNGTSQFGTSASQPTPLANATSAFTVSGWWNITAYPSSGQANLLGNTEGSANGWELAVVPSGRLYIVGFTSGTQLAAHVDGALTAGTRQNIIWTYDGSGTVAGTHLYVNGTAVTLTADSATLSGTLTPDEAFLIMGARPSSLDNLVEGTMDHLRVYSRVLASADIALIQTGGN